MVIDLHARDDDGLVLGVDLVEVVDCAELGGIGISA